MERSSTPPPAVDVDEEYDRAFRSKSFLDLWTNAHHHLRKKSSSFKAGDDHNQDCNKEEQSCSSYTVLDDFVLEPSPEELELAHGGGGLIRRRRRKHRVDSLLMEFFEVTQEACEACSALLGAIGAARRHHLTLRRLLCRMEMEVDKGGEDSSAAAALALAEHVGLDNPLGPARLSAFHDVHARCGPLATRLAAAQRRLRRLARAARVARGTAAAALVTASAAAIVAAVVFAAHAVVGVGAAVAAASPVTAVRWAAGKVMGGERHYARAGATVDAAARGAYIVGRDLDTLTRMVRRAHDELEHGRHVARIAVEHGERPLLQEVAREEAECEADLRTQLEELEEHVCLCLITINRSRRMVAHHFTNQTALNKQTPSSTA